MKADLDEAPGASPHPRLDIEPMTRADLRVVMRIEAASFSTTWPPSAFSSELTDNKVAHYFVGRQRGEASGEIVAYGGIWVMFEDSHVTTIAVAPSQRGKKYGEEMLLRMLREAVERGASWITLEARESNLVAQNLYRKYGFTTVSIRRAYYSDNGENAVVMWAGNLRGDLYQNRLLALERALDRDRVREA